MPCLFQKNVICRTPWIFLQSMFIVSRSCLCINEIKSYSMGLSRNLLSCIVNLQPNFPPGYHWVVSGLVYITAAESPAEGWVNPRQHLNKPPCLISRLTLPTLLTFELGPSSWGTACWVITWGVLHYANFMFPPVLSPPSSGYNPHGWSLATVFDLMCSLTGQLIWPEMKQAVIIPQIRKTICLTGMKANHIYSWNKNYWIINQLQKTQSFSSEAKRLLSSFPFQVPLNSLRKIWYCTAKIILSQKWTSDCHKPNKLYFI